ncbi:MAG: methylated-DNA--[protein]-cysteine S-methyltransferase [bacterium]
MLYTMIDSPIGALLATGRESERIAPGGRPALLLTGLYTYGHSRVAQAGWERDDEIFADVRGQLDEYFAGRRRDFDVLLASGGTPFQRSVWQALRAIPYGGTTSYGAIASGLGAPKASRAVGAANGRNPISIIVPCHRVIRGTGALTGYAGGTETKRWLLAHERAHA